MASDRNINSKTANLDMDIYVVPKTVSDVLSEISLIHDFSIKSSRLDFHINLLEEELIKIQGFKRELPYCMHLLQDAIERLKKESLRLRKTQEGKEEERNGGAEASNNKKAWMSRVRLWNAPVHFDNRNDASSSKSEEKRGIEEVMLSVPVEPVTLIEKQQKKQRRCWSPDLHKLFVDALSKLGGPYVATPKQIRDLMKLEGLTSDEVKSHLQKYRLHVKKFPGAWGEVPPDVEHA